MANPEHLAILTQGVEVWNNWRKDNADIVPDLCEVNLRGARLYGIDFSKANLKSAFLHDADLRLVTLAAANAIDASFAGANLYGANMKGANLSGAFFTGCTLYWAAVGTAEPAVCILREADMTGAIFKGAFLNDADLTMAHMQDTDFTDASLKGVIFSNVKMDGANLTGATLGGTTFSDVDLTSVRGLEHTLHESPSAIDVRTLTKSNLPPHFLRGVGMPDTLIDYVRSLTAHPIQFHSCFISYSTADEAFATKVFAELQGNGVRCWFAPHDIQGGRKIYEQIDEAIRVYDRLLLILSDASMNSEWVKTEIANARQREIREKRQMLFPISVVPYDRIKEWRAFDADTGKDSAREIREYFVPDFSNWKDHDSYQQAFHRLLRDLKAEGGTGGSGR